MSQTVEFEGTQHIFPDDFSQADIRKALSSTESTSTGISVPRGMIGKSSTGPDTVLGGAGRRVWETVKGAAKTFFGPPTDEERKSKLGPLASIPAARIAKGAYESGKQALKQSSEQMKQAREVGGKDPVVAGLRGAQAVTTGLSALDPFATGSITRINELESQGRSREALGTAAVDLLSLVAGKYTGNKPSIPTKLSKLAYATDAETMGPLQSVLPDIEATAKANGKSPSTVGELYDTIKQTSDQMDSQFNQHLQQMGTRQIHTQPIADALKAKADSLPRSASAEATALRDEAKLYDSQATSARELNADRMYRSDNLRSFYNKGLAGQMSAARSAAQTMADKIVYDQSRDLLYDEMERQFPGQDFKTLKRKQGAMLEIQDKFKDHIDKLDVNQAKSKGRPLRERVRVSAVATPHAGVHPFFHQPMSRGNPLGNANIAVKQAFGPTAAASARRAAVLSMPLSEVTEDQNQDSDSGESQEEQ